MKLVRVSVCVCVREVCEGMVGDCEGVLNLNFHNEKFTDNAKTGKSRNSTIV